MNERPTPDVVEQILRRRTNSLPVPNVWAASWAVPQGAAFWFAQADNGKLQPKGSPGRGDDK